MSRRTSEIKNEKELPEAKVLYDYVGSTADELDIKVSDVVKIISSENDDWWSVIYIKFVNNNLNLYRYVRNSISGREGYVPRTYISLVDNQKHLKEEKHVENESKIFANKKYETVDSESGSQSELDEEESESEDEEYNSEETDEFEEEVQSPTTKQRKATRQKKILLDILANESCIEPEYVVTERTGITPFISPRVSPSGIGFQDLFYDPKKKQIRPYVTHCTLAFSLLEARDFLDPPHSFTTIGRYVRIALYDKSKIASLLFPKDDENTCFARVNDLDFKLCILFEFVLVARPDIPSAGVREFACGWGLFPLYTADGNPVETKSYDIKIHADESLHIGKNTPKLSIRVWKVGKKVREKLDKLPERLIGFLSMVDILVQYREIMAFSLAKNMNIGSALLSPSLALVPKILEQTDLAALLVLIWIQKQKGMKKKEK
ncbi:Nephrocystin-1, partial [Nowakowskiella sp. JEL0078]